MNKIIIISSGTNREPETQEYEVSDERLAEIISFFKELQLQQQERHIEIRKRITPELIKQVING